MDWLKESWGYAVAFLTALGAVIYAARTAYAARDSTIPLPCRGAQTLP
jgi:hypothetical protein